MSEAKSIGKIFVYNDMKILLTTVSSATLLAKLIKASYPTVLNAIKTVSLFRGG
jgi:hypothetical protein